MVSLTGRRGITALSRPVAAAAHLHLLFCLRSAPAARLETALRDAGVDCASYALVALDRIMLEFALAAALDSADVDGAAARFVATLCEPARDRPVEPALLQIAGRALWPWLNETPDRLTCHIDDALAAHCVSSIDVRRRPAIPARPVRVSWRRG